MDISTLLKAWPLGEIVESSPLVGGTNNSAWLIRTEDKQEYVLHVIPAQRNSLSHIFYEDRLLSALNEKRLPFALPRFLKAHDGQGVLVLEGQNEEQDSRGFATLSPRLPGELIDYSPVRHDPKLLRHAGTTLATLDAALASLLASNFVADETRVFGDLTNIHPLVARPQEAVARLPVAHEQIEQLSTLLSRSMECATNLYQRLPQQIVHRDYDPSNILVEGTQVVSVLDFELAGRDLRIFDLCVALSWWPVRLMDTGQEWDVIDSFATAYLETFPLSEEELQALPDMLRLRDATSLVSRMGRYFAGIETDATLQKRVQHSLWREEWLTANRATLQQHSARWLKN